MKNTLNLGNGLKLDSKKCQFGYTGIITYIHDKKLIWREISKIIFVDRCDAIISARKRLNEIQQGSGLPCHSWEKKRGILL